MLPKFKPRQCGSSSCKDDISGIDLLTIGIPDRSKRMVMLLKKCNTSADRQGRREHGWHYVICVGNAKLK